MEETLTLARVIENIYYVYGEKLVKTVLAFLLFEIIALVVLLKNKPGWLNRAKYVVLVIAVMVSILFAWRARSYVGYDKLHRNQTICSTKTSLEDRAYEDFSRSEELIYEYHYEKVKGPSEKVEFDESFLCKETSNDYFRQTLICFFVLMTGFAFTRCVLKGKSKLLTVFLSAPVGAGITIALTILIMVFRIPYYLITVVLGFALIWCGMTAYSVKQRLKLCKQDVMLIAVLLAGATFSALLKFYQFGGDSRWQVAYAMELIKMGRLSVEYFTQAAAFGFYGVSLHAIALLAGVDYLYSFYLLMIISEIGIIIVTTYLLSDKYKKEKFIFVAIGLTVLFLNFDYEFFSLSILSNGSVGVFIVAIVALTALYINKFIDCYLIIAICAFAILTTRVEGVCYIALLLCIPFEREGMLKRVNCYVGIEIVLWQIAQFLYSSGKGFDGWTPTKGIVLIVLGVVLGIEPYLKKVKLVYILGRKYQALYMVVLLGIVGIGFVYDSQMAMDNLTIFLSHISVSKWSNSLSFWSYIFLILPFAVIGAIRDKKSILSMFYLSILMVYGISIFRTGNPFHTQLSDSFRRILCQFMPTTIWLVSYYAAESCKSVQGENRL